VPHVADVVVFGAPGAILTDGNLTISGAACERAELAARYWLSLPQEARPKRVICVAGRPAFRSGMTKLLSGESEAASMTKIMTGLGIPNDVIRPNQQFPLDREFSVSTVDEVSILVETRLILPEWYSGNSPLAIVIHKRHGARAIDVLLKMGFKKSHILLLSPDTPDSKSEVVLRLMYRLFVLGTRRHVAPEVLQRRERHLMNMRYRLSRFLGDRALRDFDNRVPRTRGT
jgi:hypothetical protein